jgi:hypothetical protein
LADDISRLAQGKRHSTRHGKTNSLLFRTASRRQSRAREQIMSPETIHHHPEPWCRSRTAVVIALVTVVLSFS